MSVCTLFYDTVYMCNAVTAAQKLVLTLWKFYDETRSEHPTAARDCIVTLVRSVLGGCRRRRWRSEHAARRAADTSFDASVDTTEGWWVKADERLLWSNPPPTTCVSSHQKRSRYMKKGTSKLLCVLRQTRINGSFNPGGLDNQKKRKKGDWALSVTPF